MERSSTNQRGGSASPAKPIRPSIPGMQWISPARPIPEASQTRRPSPDCPPLVAGTTFPPRRPRDERRQVDTDAERTRLIRPGARQRDEDVAPGDPMDDPPVGWLVVVEGPGKGSVATLGMGVNTIGRDRSERVSLDFGDTMISRTNHGTITYDPRGRKFYVQHGGGKNLTYIDDEPVLAPRELAPLTQVQVGDTVLRFVPLCGAEFSWGDDDSGGD